MAAWPGSTIECSLARICADRPRGSSDAHALLAGARLGLLWQLRARPIHRAVVRSRLPSPERRTRHLDILVELCRHIADGLGVAQPWGPGCVSWNRRYIVSI